MKKIVDELIGTNFTMSFFNPAKNNKLNTFKNMSKVTTCNHYAHSYSRFIFKNPYFFHRNVQYVRNLFLISPGTIINIFGWSRRNSKIAPPKSALLHKLEKDVELVTKYFKDSAYLADGMTTVCTVKSLKSTYSEFSVRLLNTLCQMEVNQKEMMLFLTFMRTIQ